MASGATRTPCHGETQWMVMSNSSSASTIALTRGTLTVCWPCSPMMSPGPTVWMVATFMGAKHKRVLDAPVDHGPSARRACGPRKWPMLSPRAEPVSFHRTADGAIIAEVQQSVRDLEGKPLQGQTHGLKDKTVGHVFRLREGKVARFDIQDAP